MTTKMYETELSQTQAKVIELEQKIARVDELMSEKEQAGKQHVARSHLATFLQCVQRNQSATGA
ncbi:MAG: hypothetical protein ACI9QL_003561 [Candidatus Omnitrophota bacterium]|jgi:hypothetical protein